MKSADDMAMNLFNMYLGSTTKVFVVAILGQILDASTKF